MGVKWVSGKDVQADSHSYVCVVSASSVLLLAGTYTHVLRTSRLSDSSPLSQIRLRMSCPRKDEEEFTVSSFFRVCLLPFPVERRATTLGTRPLSPQLAETPRHRPHPSGKGPAGRPTSAQYSLKSSNHYVSRHRPWEYGNGRTNPRQSKCLRLWRHSGFAQREETQRSEAAERPRQGSCHRR
ncbi:hypothetical protein C7M84_000476 [Penaeus vannamei]|uniref:Uncharacterized protein n=1 Tax=Penaeus vannamei TaxID=6689 RepID=A0A3R7MF17_PENVA|nr:hypothetical protein C7M84_000476 [Penaeus vannamei]